MIDIMKNTGIHKISYRPLRAQMAEFQYFYFKDSDLRSDHAKEISEIFEKMAEHTKEYIRLVGSKNAYRPLYELFTKLN